MRLWKHLFQHHTPNSRTQQLLLRVKQCLATPAYGWVANGTDWLCFKRLHTLERRELGYLWVLIGCKERTFEYTTAEEACKELMLSESSSINMKFHTCTLLYRRCANGCGCWRTRFSLGGRETAFNHRTICRNLSLKCNQKVSFAFLDQAVKQ